jgi:hypothetical protein
MPHWHSPIVRHSLDCGIKAPAMHKVTDPSYVRRNGFTICCAMCFKYELDSNFFFLLFPPPPAVQPLVDGRAISQALILESGINWASNERLRRLMLSLSSGDSAE